MTKDFQRGVPRLDAGGTLNKPRRNAAGFLEVDAYLSRTGVYEYPQADGSTVYELREEADVFAPAALAGFLSVPVTQEHPPAMVTPENARDYTRGIVQGQPWRDGDKVAATLVIHDAELAGEVERGERAGVSPGYLCDVEPAPPDMVVDGKPIHGIQRNIRPNHVAACKYPRGGDSIRVRLDGLSTSGEDGGSPAPTTGGRPRGAAMTMKKVMIGGLPYEIPEHAALALEQQERLRQDSATATAEKVRTAEEEAGKQRARADSLAEEKTKLEEKVTKLDAALAEARSPKAQAAQVKARVALETTAHTVLGKVVKLDGKDVALSECTEEQIRVAVLQKRNPDFKLDAIPEGQREGYLRFRFDEEAKRVERERQRRQDEGEGPMHDAIIECPNCKGAKVVNGAPCPVCGGTGMVEVEPAEDEPMDGERQDAEPRRVPAGQRRDGHQDAKAEYLTNLNNMGLLPSQRPTK